MANHITYRSIITLMLIAAFLTNVSVLRAQTVDDRQAKIAAAFKVFEEASALGRNGDTESVNGAIKKLESIEKVFEELGEKEKLAATLAVHGGLLIGIGPPDAALELMNRGLVIYKSLGNSPGQATVLLAIGSFHYQQKDVERARDALEEARVQIEKQPVQSFDLHIYQALGNVYIELKERSKATEVLWKAYLVAKDRTPVEAVTTLRNYANAQTRLDTPKFAVSFFESALKWAQAHKLVALEVDILNDMGDLWMNYLEDLPKAKEYLDKALAKIDATSDEALKSRIYYNLGYWSYQSIRMQEALAYYERSKAIAIKIKNRAYEANIAANTGMVIAFFNDHKRAIPYYEQALAYFRASGEKQGELQVLASLAKSQAVLEDRSALANYVAALAIATDLAKKGVTRVRSFAINLMLDFGNFALAGGQREMAMEFYSKALDKAREWGRKNDESALLNNIAKIHELNGDNTKALEVYNSSLALSQSLGRKYGQAKTLENLMTVWSKLGNRNFAAFYGKNAVNIYQDFRKGLIGLSVEEQKVFLKTVEGTYRSLASLLVAQGRIAEAEQVLTMLKEEELIDYVRRDDTVAKDMLATMTLTEDERIALERYRSFAERVTALGKEFGEIQDERQTFAVGEFPKQKQYDELKQQLEDASTAFEKFLESLKLKFGQTDTRVAQVDSSLKKTLERLKATRTAVVSTIVGSDTLNIIVTTSKTQRAHTVKVSAEEINNLVVDLRRALTSPQFDPRPSSQKLYDLIVKPIEGDLAGIKADTIVWSLDGTLRYLPPAALWDKQKGYLVERFANVIVNLANRTSLEKEPANIQKLSILGVGVSKANEGFGPLDAVPDELDCIVSDKTAGILSAKPQCSTGVLNGRKLLDEKFTLANFAGELGRYPIVHIASHFKLVPGDDKNSFLLLGGGTDRKFTVEKLRNEPLGELELMVLSACNTATPAGSKANGIEVESFGALAQEEARTVLATLWAVADPSTKEFMVEFYRLYAKEGLSKAVAMRRAQIKLMYGNYSANEAQKVRADEFVTAKDAKLPPFKSDPNAPYAHPFYWSPFTLSGNWR